MVKITPTVLIKINSNNLPTSHWQRADSKQKTIFSNGDNFIELKNFTYPEIFFEVKGESIKGGYNLLADSFTFEFFSQKFILKTPLLGELQLFYYQSKNIFFAADSFAALTKLLKDSGEELLVDGNGLVELLTLNFNLAERTFFQGIKKLGENRILVFKNKKLSIKQREKIEDQVKPFALINKNKTKETFEKYFIDQMKKLSSLYKKEQWGSCLSGGTDSAISTYFANRVKPTVAVSALIDSDDRENQLAVINKITDCLKIETFTINDNETNLLNDLDELLLADPYIDPYGNWSVAFAHEFLDQNIDLVFTGLGSDDYFLSPMVNKKINKHNKFNLAEYFLEKIKNNEIDRKKKSLLHKTLSNSTNFYYVPWRNLGIWPVSPFISNDIISFSLYLDRQEKLNKEFLKFFIANKLNFDINYFSKKLSLKSAFINSLRKELSTNFSFNKKIVELNLLNLNKIKEKISNNNIDQNEYTFFFMILKINKFLNFFD